MKESKKYKKWLKALQKDMNMGLDIKRKELFGKKDLFSIVGEYLKRREIERIKKAREWFEDDFRAFIKKEHPEINIDNATFKWNNLEWIPNWLKEGLK